MSTHSNKDRQCLRFKITPAVDALIEFELCDREGLPIREEVPLFGLHFATPTGCRTAIAFGLLQGELMIVDLGQDRGLMASSEEGYDDHRVSVFAVLPVRSIVARGVSW